MIDALLARCRFPEPGSTVTCAVSGGADSSAMLALAVAAGCVATAVHVEHGLRPGSSCEADVVRRTAEALGAGFSSVTVVVPPGPNLEARARTERYRVLPSDVMTGHTADDQAETVVLNLLRGSSTRGLSAMRPGLVRRGVQRPILALRRSETVALCAHLGLRVVDDRSNRDLRFSRNRIRHELLPAMAEVAGRDLVPVLCRQSDLMRDDEDLLCALAGEIDPTDARALARAPLPLARRAVRTWLASADPERGPADLATVGRVLEVAGGRAAACDVGAGREVRRTGQRLRLANRQ